MQPYNFDKGNIPKAYKRIRKKKCDWCGYTTKLDIHKDCTPKPDYHDFDKLHAWFYDPVRPTREGYKYMRELTPRERWLAERIENKNAVYED